MYMSGVDIIASKHRSMDCYLDDVKFNIVEYQSRVIKHILDGFFIPCFRSTYKKHQAFCLGGTVSVKLPESGNFSCYSWNFSCYWYSHLQWWWWKVCRYFYIIVKKNIFFSWLEPYSNFSRHETPLSWQEPAHTLLFFAQLYTPIRLNMRCKSRHACALLPFMPFI